jgi:hypothetical protein
MKTQLRNILFLLIVIGLSTVSLAQEAEQIQSDRPGQANSANTVGYKNLQIQMGYNHNNDVFNGGVSGTFGTSVNSFSPLFRIGLFEKTEIGLGYNFASIKNYLNSDEIGDTQNDGSYTLNIRQNLLNGKNNVGILAGYNSNFEKNFRDKTPYNLAFQALSSHSLSERFGLSTNLIYNVDVNPTIATNQSLAYVLNLAYSVSDKVGVFIENYGQVGDAWRPLFDGGIAYLINNNFQLDLSLGYGPNYNAQRSYFIDFGLSYRLIDIFRKGAFKP